MALGFGANIWHTPDALAATRRLESGEIESERSDCCPAALALPGRRFATSLFATRSHTIKFPSRSHEISSP